VKHTIKTQHGRSMVLELSAGQTFGYIELHGAPQEPARSYCELLEVEQLHSLVIAAECMIARIRSVQEGNKRMAGVRA